MTLRDAMRRRGFALVAVIGVALLLAPGQGSAQAQEEAGKAESAGKEIKSDLAVVPKPAEREAVGHRD